MVRKSKSELIIGILFLTIGIFCLFVLIDYKVVFSILAIIVGLSLLIESDIKKLRDKKENGTQTKD